MTGKLWLRLYAEFASDPKVQTMPEHMQRRLVMLLCMRCADVPMTDEYVGFTLRLTEEETMATKALFVERGFIDESWSLRNWNKRQFESDSSTSRVRKHRTLKGQQHNGTDETSQERQCNGNETFHDRYGNAPRADTDTDTDTDTEQRRKKRGARARKSKTQLPSGFELTPEMLTWAAKEGFTPELTRAQFEQFTDHHRAKGSTFKDWVAAFRTWMRRSKSFPGGLTPAANKQEVRHAPEP